MASLRTAADVVNVSLTRIGRKDAIGSLYDGSEASQLALTLYGQTRDQMLRDNDWDFAMRNMALTLLKFAPVGGYIPGINPWDPATNPPIPWFFSYGYPDDCIKVRSIKPTPIFIPNFDPQINTFQIDNDNSYTPARRVILTDVENALMVYTGRVTDPATWAPDFAEALTNELGLRLAPALVGLEQAQAEAAQGAVKTNVAAMEQG